MRMTEETKTTTQSTEASAPKAEQTPKAPAEKTTGAQSDKKERHSGDKRNFRRRPRSPRGARPKPEFDQTILSIRRVTRVMAGGRRFSFSVTLALGDRKGRVGIGIGKAADTALAIQKAINDARRNMVTLKLTDSHSIPYSVAAKYNSARVSLRPNYGRGIVAGSSVRSVLELGGIKDVTGRILSRSKNHLNNTRALIEALRPFVIRRGVAPAPARKPAGKNFSRPRRRPPQSASVDKKS